MESARSSREAFFDCVEELVLKYDGQDGFAGGRLTGKKLVKLQAVFETLPNERIIWLLDTSNWYNASYGLIVTDKGLRWKNRNAELSKTVCLSWKKFGETDTAPKLLKDGVLKLARAARLDMDVNVEWKEKWLPVIVSLWEYWREGTFEKCDEKMTLDVSVSDDEEEVGSASRCEIGSQLSVTEEKVLKAVAAVDGGLYCRPNIPEKKLINAKVAMGVPPGELVYVLMDTTFFGSAKTGLVLTNWGVRWANDWSTETKRTAISWEELHGNGSYSVDGFDLKLADGAVVCTAGGGMSAENLGRVISCIVGCTE